MSVQEPDWTIAQLRMEIVIAYDYYAAYQS